jgi:hypothetical protein
MSKKKKNSQQNNLSENCKIYFDLWIRLNKSHEEEDIDKFRQKMNVLWNYMTKQEKEEFKNHSELYEKNNEIKKEKI